jgi:hypothetical protein
MGGRTVPLTEWTETGLFCLAIRNQVNRRLWKLNEDGYSREWSQCGLFLRWLITWQILIEKVILCSKELVIGLASQFSLVRTMISSTNHFDIVLPFMPRCPKVFQKDFAYFLFSLCILQVFPNLIPSVLIILTMLGEGYCLLRCNAIYSGNYLLMFWRIAASIPTLKI